MIQIGSIVKCVKGEPGILNEGDLYTVTNINSSGNLLLEELTPPEGFTSFNSTRFEETGETVYSQMREYLSEFELEELA
jgi:hypothetical protein